MYDADFIVLGIKIAVGAESPVWKKKKWSDPGMCVVGPARAVVGPGDDGNGGKGHFWFSGSGGWVFRHRDGNARGWRLEMFEVVVGRAERGRTNKIPNRIEQHLSRHDIGTYWR